MCVCVISTRFRVKIARVTQDDDIRMYISKALTDKNKKKKEEATHWKT